MKKIIIAPLVLLTVIISCNTGKNKSSLLQKPDDIKADEYIITIDRDTTLVTKNGALLYIPKGSLSNESGRSVTLEIKEAYTAAQMILAGLTTRAGDEQLSSGGMIYIGVPKGQNVKINQPIRVAIPTGYLDKKMRLYNGEKDADGNIIWKDPVPLPENKQLAAKEEGIVLFQQKCGNCHGMGKQLSGPDLAHVTERFSRYERKNIFYSHLVAPDSVKKIGLAEGIGSLNDYDTAHKKDSVTTDVIGTPEPDRTYFSGDLYFCNLRQIFGIPDPSKLKPVSQKELRSIYRYIKDESNRLNLPLPAHAWLDESVDSCKIYTNNLQKLNEQKQKTEDKREKLVSKNGQLVEVKNDAKQKARWINKPLPPLQEFEETVSPECTEAHSRAEDRSQGSAHIN